MSQAIYMIVRVTGELAKQIGVSATTALPLAVDPFGDWTCRVFSLRGGQPLMLITNTTALYSLLVPASRMENTEQFHYDLTRNLERYLSADGLESILKHHVEPKLYTLYLAKSLNRSVTGSMTDMVKLSEFMLV